MKNTVFGDVMLCDVVGSTRSFEDPVASIFSVKDSSIRFLQDVNICVSKFVNVITKNTLVFQCSFCMIPIKLELNFLLCCMSYIEELHLLVGNGHCYLLCPPLQLSFVI